jgi:predicted AAA+ superfamily ATPase
LLWHLIRAWAASDPDPWPATLASLAQPHEVGHLVESTVAIHLRRAFGERVFSWRPDERREIDCVVAPPGSEVALAEVKYQSRIDERDVRALAGAGGGLVVSRDFGGSLAQGGVYAVPAGELLAGLDAPSLARAQA